MANAAGCRVKFHIADADNVWYLRFAAFCLGAAKDGADAGHQFAWVEGLGEIVVRSDLEPDNTVNVLAPRRQQQNRNPRTISDSAQDVEAVQPGKHNIKHHQQMLSTK